MLWAQRFRRYSRIKLGRSLKMHPLAYFLKKSYKKNFFFAPLLEFHPETCPYLVHRFQDLNLASSSQKMTKNTKKWAKKTPKNGHFSICKSIAPKLQLHLAPNWLSIYPYVTTLYTLSGRFLASFIKRQDGHKFGLPKNVKNWLFPFLGFLPPECSLDRDCFIL